MTTAPDRVEVEMLLGLWASRQDDPRDTPAVLLARFAPEPGREADLMVVFARPDGPADRTDPISEVGAVLSAAAGTGHLTRATMLVPARLRDLAQDEVIATSIVTTWIEPPSGAAGSWRMGSAMTGWALDDGQVLVAPNSDPMAAEDSPVASLLHDAVTARPPGPLGLVVAGARVLGMDVVHTREAQLRTGTTTQQERVRHRLRRLAGQLGRRNVPEARQEVAERIRPGVPVNLPDGFVPACPF